MLPKRKRAVPPPASPEVVDQPLSEAESNALNLVAVPTAVIAVVLEFLSAKSLLSAEPSAFGVLGLHLLALLAAVPALRLVFPEEYRRLRWTFAALVVGFALPLPLLQKAIQDSDEQVRLLAQTLFNQIIAGLEGRVKTLEADLAKPPRHLNKLLLLAEQYHELVYLGLATDETQTIYLGRAIELLEEAARTAPDNTAVRFLLVKCALKGGRLDQARAGLQFLRTKGFAAEVLGPWEAEIAFLERDWQRLAESLRKLDASGDAPGALKGPLEFWLQPGKA